MFFLHFKILKTIFLKNLQKINLKKKGRTLLNLNKKKQHIFLRKDSRARECILRSRIHRAQSFEVEDWVLGK